MLMMFENIIKKFVIGNEINFNKVMNDINSYNLMLKKGIDTKNILDNKGNQQVNINIINNQITNIICNDNNDVSFLIIIVLVKIRKMIVK